MALENINSKDFKEMLDNEGENLEIIDVREKDEYDLIKIKGSKLIPLSEIGNSLDKIDWSKKVVFVCRSGSRSGYVAQMLAQSGKDVINLAGGVYELNLDDCDCLEKASGCCGGYF
ncbi:MAG: rhodanese domain-containing protein [Parcubacteria group bacterium Athens0714_25]|nr:MAG: rhodanese domain-containing protein [Parcubacteria group bacterium Athens0714_25]